MKSTCKLILNRNTDENSTMHIDRAPDQTHVCSFASREQSLKNNYLRTKLVSLFSAFLLFFSIQLFSQNTNNIILLNGQWDCGENRQYSLKVNVPGLASDPSKMNEGVMWYKRQIVLPLGDWKYATLLLKGARFAPEVYINGEKVSQQEGGMAPTYHLLKSAAVKPGATVTLEIALVSLKNLPQTDASYIPPADQWRSNISSSLWDDVILFTHSNYRIKRMTPMSDLAGDRVVIRWELEDIDNTGRLPVRLTASVIDKKGTRINKVEFVPKSMKGELSLPLKNIVKPWSPEIPELYKLELAIYDNNKVADSKTINFGQKSFSVAGKGFQFNGTPVTLRSGTVVWHRWVRDKEGQLLAWDTTWFRKNVIVPMKDRGANTLRFHLGVPPERILDLCDKYGLFVQLEWSFFHGMPASKASLDVQWKNWMDLGVAHPSVTLFHPYNETEGDQLKTAWLCLDSLVKDYPPLVLAERDVIHVHKYWWSLFENLGCYYDNADQFPKAIMVDEFGGNYLDGNNDLGGYRTLRESYMRFLGRDHTREMRSYHHSISNARVAEYWRRIGAAGFSPFCILGSWEDGNHWYLGAMKKPGLKPVWDAMTASWSPLSLSLDIWDRSFVPEQKVKIPLYIFNDLNEESPAEILVWIEKNNATFSKSSVKATLVPHSKIIKEVSLKMPAEPGEYIIKAELANVPASVKNPIVSKWDVKVVKANIPASLVGKKIGIAADELELQKFAASLLLPVTSPEDPSASVIMMSRKSYEKLQSGDASLSDKLSLAIDNGKHILILDVGDRNLGQGYPVATGELGPLQGVVKLENGLTTNLDLFKGLSLSFTQVAEPESHIHKSQNDSSLWVGLKHDQSWLWNGYRGGLIVPASEMLISGLSQDAFISYWKEKGADVNLIKSNAYFVYSLQNIFTFSSNLDDKTAESSLRDKAKFLADDAPALANTINRFAPIKVIDLAAEYKKCVTGQAKQLIPLVNAGKNLTRIPVIMVDFGPDKGKLIVSQLLTAGRMATGFGSEGLYGIRYDESTRQFVLNMLNKLISNK